MAFADQVTLLAQRVAAEFKAVRAANKSGLTPPSGAWQQPANMLGASGAVATSGHGSFEYYDVGPNPLTLQAIGVYCSTAQVGGATTITIGLYADDGTGGAPLLTPTGLLVSGPVTAGGVGNKTVATSLTLQPGRYWGAFLYVATAAPTTPPQWNCINNASPSLWLANGPGIGTSIRALRITGLTALPTAPATLAGTGGTDAPVVGLRAA